MSQVNVNALFSKANSIIARLPTKPDESSFYDLVDTTTPKKLQHWNDTAHQLLELAADAPLEKVSYFEFWASDAFVAFGELTRAIAVAPIPVLGARSSMQTDRLLTLKMVLGQKVSGRDIITLFGPKLTRFGRDNITGISQYLETRVSEIQEHEGRNLLSEWAPDSHKHLHGMALFSGHMSYILTPDIIGHYFSLSSKAQQECITLMRDAENTFREEADLPRVGEGWIAETALYYAVKSAFPEISVVQHGRPIWLGRQHLDIYLPEQKVALEYQGEQHDRPIAFFGGEEAFQRNVQRDQIKRAKCKRHGVTLIYVREGYLFSDVVQQIKKALA